MQAYKRRTSIRDARTCHARFMKCTPMRYMLLRAADRYACTGCGSTACSVGTVYGGRGHLYTPGVCPGLLATPCIASLATPRRLAGDHLAPHRRSPCASPAITLCLTGDHLMPHRRSPLCLTGDAL